MALKKLEDCALFLLKTPGWDIPFGTFPAMRMVLDKPISPRSSKERGELHAQCEHLYDKRCQEWKGVLMAADRAKRNFYPHLKNLTPKDIIFLRVQGISPETDENGSLG